MKDKGVRMVPYHLHKLVKAESVFVVEGEKDVKTVEGMGLAATTLPGGAITATLGGNKKWRPEYAQWFKGKEVIILPDNDKPGREHAQTVAMGLFTHAESVRILNLPVPEGRDVSDWAEGPMHIRDVVGVALPIDFVVKDRMFVKVDRGHADSLRVERVSERLHNGSSD